MKGNVAESLLGQIRERQEKEKAERLANWISLSHRERAEILLAKTDPFFIRESDMPRLAMAQVHATLALTEKAKD